MRLLFATNNNHKFKEVSKILPQTITLLSLKDVDFSGELRETGLTIKSNASQKARYVYEKFGMNCFADDTGLEVQAIGGRPGVYSARFAGPACRSEDNIQKVLAELKGTDNRKANFRTVISMIIDGHETIFEGIVDGVITEIPEGEKQSKGRAIQNLIQLPGDDKVKTIIDVKKLDDKEYVQNHYIVLCTKKGIIKKTSLEDFSRPRANGIIAITINEGDELLSAEMTDGNKEIMLAVKSGRAIRFPESKVRSTGRGAIGVAGIEVNSDTDEVVGMICVNKEDASRTILVVSEKGYGKRTAIDEYRITNRGGKGVKTINVTGKTGNLVGILYVTEKEDLIITCKSGVTIRTGIVDIREAGRATQGVTLIRLDDGDEIAAISHIEEQVDETVIVKDETLNDTEIGTDDKTEDNTDKLTENQ